VETLAALTSVTLTEKLRCWDALRRTRRCRWFIQSNPLGGGTVCRCVSWLRHNFDHLAVGRRHPSHVVVVVCLPCVCARVN
jgi:hypothetical protein